MAIVFVQAAGNSSDSASTLSATISAPTAGNQLVVFVQTDALTSAISLSALTSQVWSAAYKVDGSATQPDIAFFLSTNCGTGTTVTLNNGSAVGCALVVMEFSGTANSGSADLAGTNSGVSTSSVSSWAVGSQTPVTANDVALTLLGIDLGGGTVTAPTGYTVPTNGSQSTANRKLTAAYKIKTDSAAEAPSWSRSATTAGFAGMILAKPAGATANPQLPIVVDSAVARASSW